MTIPPAKSLAILVRQQRKRAGFSQETLARTLNVSQSVISKIETAKWNKVSDHQVVLVCEHLGIEDPLSLREDVPAPARLGIPTIELRFCPQQECPSNVPFVNPDGKVAFHPAVTAVPSNVTVRHCEDCGDILNASCPHCGSKVRGGAYCIACGQALIEELDSAEPSVADWSRERAVEIHRLRTLTGRLPVRPESSVPVIESGGVSRRRPLTPP